MISINFSSHYLLILFHTTAIHAGRQRCKHLCLLIFEAAKSCRIIAEWVFSLSFKSASSKRLFNWKYAYSQHSKLRLDNNL
ncbi:hypothetical protein DL96DRAFT_1584195 [Flagelloscypha sp. PMI_526]|nr:hypothetical protein DL96DRAFT_1584195 [Flagelloscypha sp. PMI_526]